MFQYIFLWRKNKLGRGVGIMSIVCSVKDAFELMQHMDEDDMVILTVLDRKTLTHGIPKRVRKRKGKELIKKADNILYQDNDFFGIFFLYGVRKEKEIIHNILFPQLE